VAGEQRAAGDGEILLSALAAEAESAIGAAGLVSLYRAAGRANRSAVGVEGCLSLRIRHAEDLSEAQGLCCTAEEEVLH
jgi:hypothetical protein